MPIKENGNNKCSICGNVNEGKSVYCGICGKKINPQAEDTGFEEQLEEDDSFESEIAEQDIETANSGKNASELESDQILDEIEDGRMIAEVRQVKSAWLLSSGPWLIVILAIMLFMEPITEIIAIMMAVVVVVPRFFLWLRSSYVLTENVLI